MRRALGSSKIVVIDAAAPTLFTVAGKVELTPVDDAQAGSVTMGAEGSAGKEVGNVEQSNHVPLAAARGSWAGFGDIVAQAAVEGILELLEKACNQPRYAARGRVARIGLSEGGSGLLLFRQAARFCMRKMAAPSGRRTMFDFRKSAVAFVRRQLGCGPTRRPAQARRSRRSCTRT
jgi:hypothetical protein